MLNKKNCDFYTLFVVLYYIITMSTLTVTLNNETILYSDNELKSNYESVIIIFDKNANKNIQDQFVSQLKYTHLICNATQELVIKCQEKLHNFNDSEPTINSNLIHEIFNKKLLSLKKLTINNLVIDDIDLSSTLFKNMKIKSWCGFFEKAVCNCMIPNIQMIDLSSMTMISKTPYAIVHRLMLFTDVEYVLLNNLSKWIYLWDYFVDPLLVPIISSKWHSNKIKQKTRIINCGNTSSEAYHGFSYEFMKIMEKQCMIILLDECHNMVHMKSLCRQINNCVDACFIGIRNDEIEQYSSCEQIKKIIELHYNDEYDR